MYNYIITIASVKLQLKADLFSVMHSFTFLLYFLLKGWKKYAILVRVSRWKFKTEWEEIKNFSRPAGMLDCPGIHYMVTLRA